MTTILAVSPLSAHAGFDFSDNGQSIDITNVPSQSKPVSYTPPAPVNDAGEPVKLTKAARPESDPAAPALQIYNERYIPDSIKKNISSVTHGTVTASRRRPASPSPGAVASLPPSVAPFIEQPPADMAPAGQPR